MERPIFFPIKEAIEGFYKVYPPDGYIAPDGYPECCERHISYKKNYQEWFDKFPNCCDYHEKMLTSSLGFDKNWYKDVVDKILNQVSYTEWLLQEKIKNDDWYEDLTDYFEYNLESFGNPSVGGTKYIHSVQRIINDVEWIEDSKKKQLLSFFESQLTYDDTKPKPVADLDIAKLFDIYERWVKAFPFQISYFQPYKKYFETRWPILSGKGKTNRYSKITKTRLVTETELIHLLNHQTSKLLQVVNSVDLFEKGELNNYKGLRLDYAKEQYKVKQTTIFNQYEKGERKYLNTIKSWLKNELEFFKEIQEIEISKPPEKEPTKSEKLQEALSKYGFDNLPKVKELIKSQKEELINKMATNKIPYQIAMLHFLGFIEYMRSNHTRTNEMLFKRLAEILDSPQRSISGNYRVLRPKTDEDTDRYTAHAHIKTVEKDYKTLK